MAGKRRTTREIRQSLARTRETLDHDLEELELRLEESFSPKRFFARHPALVSIAGIIVGVLVVRNPALVGRGIMRLAHLGSPFLLKALVSKAASPAD
jgi:hypothetical protein